MTMTTRRERRQQKPRRHRPTPSHSRGGRNPLWRFVPALAVIGAVVALVLAGRAMGIFETGAAPIDVRDPKYDPLGEQIGMTLPDQSNTHIPAGQRASYASLPPASGSHWGAPAAPASWGIKDAELPDEVTVHNLEHGGIVISYDRLSDAEVSELRRIVSSLRSAGYNKIIMQPYSKMTDAKIAVTAWIWQIKVDTVDDVQIIKFVRAHYEGPDAPEPRVM